MGELSDFIAHNHHKEVLKFPWAYPKAIITKFLPGLYKKPVNFTLVDGSICQIHEFMSLYIYKEIFVEKCYDVELPDVEEPVIIDVGSNTGLFTLRAKQLWPKAQVFCFEPFPPNYEKLQQTIEINHLENIQHFQKGVGGRDRTASLNIHSNNIGGHSIYDISYTDKAIDIEIIDFKSVLEMTPEKKCDLLKLDCEGAEIEIIESIDASMALRIPRILFESVEGPDFDRVMVHLTELGYVTENRGEVWFSVLK
ncbi:FkbM family methyltransferase [bacterium]|nr:FkbM family methyltransferase [bacterium]